jgi:NCAIR mutase (PurE)-related protein
MSVVFDYGRRDRIGLPEAVMCEGKPAQALNDLLEELTVRDSGPVLFTRLSAELLARLETEHVKRLDYDALSRTAYFGGRYDKRSDFCTAVVTAGTSDLAVAHEAVRTLDFLGLPALLIADVGVAGPWRLQQRMAEIAAQDAVIVIAGGDAALATVLGGSTYNFVVAVPTSVGYGVASGGRAALHSMLSSCAAGVPVLNIDNGFGAACTVARVANWARRMGHGH